jgi:ABC-2 type transport system permease protein
VVDAFRLLRVFMRVSILAELQYRTNLYVQMVRSGLSLATGLAGLGVVFSHASNLAGWRLGDLLVILGVYYVISGVIRFAIQPAMERLMVDVRTGTFDYVLTKPGDSLVLVSVRATAVWRLIDVALGGAVIAYAVARGDVVSGPWEVAGFVVGLLAAVVTVYSFLVILSTLSFWFVRLENILVIFQSMYEAGKWPVGIYPGWLRAALTFVVPVAFAVTVPAGTLSGRVSVEMLGGSVLLAITLAVIARRFWFVGLRHYAGASA